MKKEIANYLLQIEAVSLRTSDPFTWSSGLKSPIYCDNRLTMSYPTIRKKIAKGLTELIRENFYEVEVIAGTATAGIPHAAWVSDGLDLPMCYVRSKAKGHGKGNQIEGLVKLGQNVVVVEDLISTGGSVISAVEALRMKGCNVLGAVSIFTYGLEKGKEQLRNANIVTYSLTDYDSLIEIALENGYITEHDFEKLRRWRQNPADPLWMQGS